ncbi:unnamed protein product [Effrenium voratum]|nr:unnamed protein product [Effrenium voratum]
MPERGLYAHRCRWRAGLFLLRPPGARDAGAKYSRRHRRSPTEHKPETFSFPSFSSWLSELPQTLASGKTDATFKLIALFASFRNSHKAAPSEAKSFAAHCKEVQCEPKVDGLDSLEQAFSHFFVEPLVHVASVLGGLLTQEVIKAITRKDPPLVNSVCFNAHTGAALVEQIPAAPPAPKKRKVEEEVADLLDD